MTTRPRTPQDTFLSDQALAFARDIATDGNTIPIVLDPPNGETCTWCDCPDGPGSPHNRRGYRCPGCPANADAILRVFASPTVRYDFPACDRHQAHVIAAVAQLTSG
jgi:hypothetical protein